MPAKGEHNDSNSGVQRPKPRRLFSFDSIKSSASSSSRRSSAGEVEAPRGPRPMNPLELSNVQEGDEKLEGTPVKHTRAEPSPTWQDSTPSGPSLTPPLDQSSKLEPVRPPSLFQGHTSTPSDSSDSNNRPPSKRWDSLRQHVLPPVRPSTPPQRPGSAQSHASSQQTGRSATPKPSRLARLGFRHVVEDVRDEARKFGEELLRACAAARYSSMKEKDPSTNGTAPVAPIALSGKKLDYLRRPNSMSSVSLTSSQAPPPSLRFLHQILVYHTSPSEETGAQISIHLPHESQILSTLLCPFLVPNKYYRVEEEQLISLDAFELVSKSWIPANEVRSSFAQWCKH